MNQDTAELTRELSRLLLAPRPGQQSAYSETQIEDFIASILIATGPEASQLTPELLALLARFAQRAGIESSRGEAAGPAVARYFARHPIPKALQRGFARYVRGAIATQDPKGIVEALGSICVDRLNEKAPDDQPPPEGSAGKGPLGYFSARKKLAR